MPLKISTFDAWVSVDDVELSQYAPDISPDGKVATCWIPSQADKNFKVSWKDSSALLTTQGTVWVDGLRSGSSLLRSSRQNRNEVLSRSYIRVSESACRPFLFAKPNLTDDDQYLDNPIPEDMGKIVLKVFKVEIRSGDTAQKPRRWTPLPDTGPIHERSKKTLSHQVKFGEEEQTRKMKMIPRHWVSREMELLCTFIFNYRPIEVLQANMLAPLEGRAAEPARPAPGPPRSIGEEEKPGTTDEIRIRQLKRELKALEQRQQKRVKREVKTEIVPAFLAGEVIDLT